MMDNDLRSPHAGSGKDFAPTDPDADPDCVRGRGGSLRPSLRTGLADLPHPALPKVVMTGRRIHVRLATKVKEV